MCKYIIIKTDKGQCCIFNVYIPSGYLPKKSQQLKEVEGLLNSMSKKISELKREGVKILIGGDFNSHTSNFGKYPESNDSLPKESVENRFVENN